MQEKIVSLNVAHHSPFMNSITVDIRNEEYSPVEETVAIEPVEGTNEYVILSVYRLNYKKNIKESYTVKFYFDLNKEPEILGKTSVCHSHNN